MFRLDALGKTPLTEHYPRKPKMNRTSFIATAVLMTTSISAYAQNLSANERFAMKDVVTVISAGVDRHHWDRIRNAFANEVTLDYTGLWGRERSTQSANDFNAQWSSFLPGFDETLHLVTNHTITAYDGSSAMMQADFQAAHKIDDSQWILSGHYDYELTKADDEWKRQSVTMSWAHETGDRGLVSLAADRAGLSD